ncbi:uncharacterized protein [Gossypium hirsutum]|uniref:Tf2-1-like SH3-like domain-containing protein n=1 Tax=Gossypium hirsutum TaxID=3635 RepID=A0A1U8P814_GOSHI|nr:uncharacterized protein LOC107956117 [Gossypium hirsutum]
MHPGGNKMHRDLCELYWLSSLKCEVTSDRQKCYTDLKRRDIEYTIGNFVFLKVSLWNKVLRFDCKGKLSPRFIGPYQILKRLEPIEVRLDLTFDEESVQVLDRDIKVQWRKSIPLVKVLWQNHGTKEATWESEDLVR